MSKVLYVSDWLSDARRKVEDAMETDGEDENRLADVLGRARERSRAGEVYAALEERSAEVRDAFESFGADIRIDSEATATLVTELVSTYRQEPERAVDDISAALEEGAGTAATLPRKQADGLAHRAGWMDFEEFRQAQGYAEPGITVHKHLGSSYSQFFDVVGEETWDADDLARYDLPAPDELDLSLHADDRVAFEDAVGALGEAYCRTHDVDGADSVIYRVEERDGEAIVSATFYDES